MSGHAPTGGDVADALIANNDALLHTAGTVGSQGAASPAAAEVADLLRREGSMSALGARISIDADSAHSQDEWGGIHDRTHIVTKGFDGLGAQARGIRGKYKLEFSTAAAFGAASAMSALSSGIDSYTKMSFGAVNVTHGAMSGLAGRAAGLQLSLLVPATPEQPFATLQAESRRAALLGTGALQATAALVGIDVRSAADLHQLAVHIPRLSANLAALAGLAFGAQNTTLQRSALDGYNQFAAQNLQRLAERYSGWLGGWHRTEDQAMYGDNVTLGAIAAAAAGVVDGLGHFVHGLVFGTGAMIAAPFVGIWRGLNGENPVGDFGMHNVTNMWHGLADSLTGLAPWSGRYNGFSSVDDLYRYTSNYAATLPTIALGAKGANELAGTAQRFAARFGAAGETTGLPLVGGTRPVVTAADLSKIDPSVNQVWEAWVGRDVVGSEFNAIVPGQSAVDLRAIEAIRTRIQNGETFDPVRGRMTTDGRVMITDGHHRFVAHMAEGKMPDISITLGGSGTPVPPWLENWNTVTYGKHGTLLDFLPEGQRAATSSQFGLNVGQ